MITGADIIGRALAQAGCTRAFGIPGGEVLALMEGLRAAGLGFYLTKHETAAGFMAEGHWHATGAPGVLVATIGPGVANAVNVVANAHQDRVPMIFLTGCVDRADEETYTHQIFDHQAVLRPIVKGSFRAEKGALAPMLEKALALALSGQPGPVHIDVPISVAEGETSERLARAPLVPPLGVEPGALARLRAALERAERPLAIAGVDAVNEGAGPAIQAFCEAQNIPLLTTYKGKGLIDEAHPLCLGGHGLSPKSDSLTMPLIGQADLILLLGYDPIEMRLGWRDPWHDAQEVYEIAPVARDHGMHWVTETLLSPLAPCLDALVETPQPQRWDLGAPSAARDALQAAFAPRDGFGPGTVFATLRAAMPPETVVTVDSGAHRILVSQMWEAPGPRQMLQSTALCTMACALPLAAGYKMGAMDLPVLAILGDGGLEMGLGELATLREHKLPVILCVIVDESLTLIEMKQRSGQRPNLGVDFTGSDFPALAQAMGGYGVWVDDAESLAQEAQAAMSRDTFTLLACRIGPRAYDGTF